MIDETRIHDYRKRHWGHDFSIQPHDDPVSASVIAWGYGVRRYDLLVLPKDGGGCFYIVESIRYVTDPPDMWFAECWFVPASSDLGQRAVASMDGRAVLSRFDTLSSWRVLRESA